MRILNAFGTRIVPLEDLKEICRNWTPTEWKTLQREGHVLHVPGSKRNVDCVKLVVANACIWLYTAGEDMSLYNMKEFEECGVCSRLLKPQDEAYTDAFTGRALCDEHSFYDEELDAYMARLF